MTVGDVGLVELPLGGLRGLVALVPQEHHVFVGTVRENLVLDEATSLIDPRVARHLKLSLAAVLAGRTVAELVAGGGSYAASPLTGPRLRAP